MNYKHAILRTTLQQHAEGGGGVLNIKASVSSSVPITEQICPVSVSLLASQYCPAAHYCRRRRLSLHTGPL
jgi:hypothetical protein